MTQRDTYLPDTSTSETESFTYDFLDRLTSASGPYSETYTYDAIGNITAKNGVSYSYNTNGIRPHAVNTVGSSSYQYDANGNMTDRNGQSIVWDVENRPTTIGSSTLVYDGDGSRIKKTEGGVTTVYVNQYYEKNISTGEVTTSYYLGSKLIAQCKGGTLRYIQQDSLNSTSVVSNDSGGLVASTSYTPFGMLRSITGTMPTDKLFTGQRKVSTDTNDGLYYYGARYYDATIGRFISADTIVPNPANPQTLNRYSYCLNNPLKYIDPSGHEEKVIGTGTIGGSTVVISSCEGGYWIDYGNNTYAFASTLDQIDNSMLLAAYDQGCSYASYTLGPSTGAGSVNRFVGQADSQLLHELLNTIGYFFDPADIANSGLYASEGDYANSALSGIALCGIFGSVIKTAGFKSFSSFKRCLGSLGEGNVWHHIVEQCQISKSGFSSELIQNAKNVMAVDQATHVKISSYYNSIDSSLCPNLRVRNFLAGQSFEYQYNFGINVLKKFGY